MDLINIPDNIYLIITKPGKTEFLIQTNGFNIGVMDLKLYLITHGFNKLQGFFK
jgi:hypothetical protein